MKILDAVEALRGSLDYHLERQNVLASNLAHINTPNYRAKELVRTDFEKTLTHEIATTDPRHILNHKDSTAVGKIVDDPSVAAGGDGNGVSLDREAVKIASNNVRYDAISSLVSNELSSLDWAANDGK